MTGASYGRSAAECILYGLMVRPDFHWQETSWVYSECWRPMSSHFRRAVPSAGLKICQEVRDSRQGVVDRNISQCEDSLSFAWRK